MKRSSVIAGAVLLMPALSTLAEAQPATPSLSRLQVKFNTTKQKDHDSGPQLHLLSSQDSNSLQYAYSDRLGGDTWPDNSENGPFDFHITNTMPFTAYQTSWLLIDFVTRGNNDWVADVHLRFDWSNSTTTWCYQNNVDMNVDSATVPIFREAGDKQQWLSISSMNQSDGWPDKP